jgi:hypothetical protein
MGFSSSKASVQKVATTTAPTAIHFDTASVSAAPE